MLTNLKGAEEHRSTLFLLLSEAYNNSLDHGILDLDSDIKETEDGFLDYYMLRDERLNSLTDGKIDITVKYSPETTSIYFTVTDSGEGFMHDTIELSPMEGEQEHGRGTLLLKELATTVEYNDKGNQITFSYQLNQNITNQS